MTTDELRDYFRKVYCMAKAYAKESAGYKRNYINDYSTDIKSDIDKTNKQYETIEDELESIYNKVMNYILDLKLKEEKTNEINLVAVAPVFNAKLTDEWRV